MTVTDLQKYLFQLKQLLYEKYEDAYQFVLPQILNIRKKADENKETIIKILIPFCFIALGFYACSSLQRIVVKNISDIFEISDDIRNHYTGKPDYWGLSTQIVINEHYISPKFIRNEKIIISGGNEVFIGDGVTADMVMPGTTFFDVVLPKLNKAQCIAHTEAAISEENQMKLLRISIINTSGSYQFEWGNERYGLPVSKYASKDVCIDSDNTVIWSLK